MKQEEYEEKIRFKDLSTPCKIGIVGGYIYSLVIGVIIVMFILGMMFGLLL